jgi:hypothetical protein
MKMPNIILKHAFAPVAARDRVHDRAGANAGPIRLAGPGGTLGPNRPA